MTKPKKNKIIGYFIGLYIKGLLKKFFFRISLSKEANLLKVDKTLPTIIFANHSSWWDGFVAWLITSYYLKVEDYLIMEEKQLRKYGFFRYLGVFSVDRENPSSVIKIIEFTKNLLKGSRRYLWIFPQGEIKHQDSHPVFYRGIEKIAREVGDVNLIPLSIRYEFTSEQRPEIFILAGEPYRLSSVGEFENLKEIFQEKLLKAMQELKNLVINSERDKFKTLLSGKPSRNKIIDRFYS